MRTLFLPAILLTALGLTSCGPREWLLPKLGIDPPVFRDFGEGFEPPVSAETGQVVTGFGGNGGGVTRTPLILVHGTTVSASFWKPVRAYFRAQGYTDDELWAVGYGWNNGRYFDSNELSAVTLDRFVQRVTAYLSQKTGRPIRQVDMIGHSLGNTIVRHWAKQTNGWHQLRSFIGNSGVNHGSWTLTGDPRGPNRISAFEMFAQSPWLAALNRGGETPGPTRYMTLYDGTGWRDIFYPPPFTHSPRLEGAYNLAYNVEHGGGLGHLELATHQGPLDAMHEWLRKAPEALPSAEPPQLSYAEGVVRSNDPDARVHCARGDQYPLLRGNAAAFKLVGEAVHTCFARSTRSELSSPMARFKLAAAAPSDAPLQVTAEPGSGVYEQPQSVRLSVNDPEAFIAYSTVSSRINTGMPLYGEPVYVAAPLTLTAVAYTPDGRASEPFSFSYNISMEYVEAVNTPERQLDPTAPVQFDDRRKAGR